MGGGVWGEGGRGYSLTLGIRLLGKLAQYKVGTIFLDTLYFFSCSTVRGLRHSDTFLES